MSRLENALQFLKELDDIVDEIRTDYDNEPNIFYVQQIVDSVEKVKKALD